MLLSLLSRSGVSDSLQRHGLLHARPPSLSPGVCSNSCPYSQGCHPTISSSITPFSSCSQSFPASVFSSKLALFISISPSNVYSGLIFFKIVWFYLLAVQGTLKSLLQHRSSKASVFRCSAFFMVQLSIQLILHPACIWVYTELTLWHTESELHSSLRDCLASLAYWKG